MAENDIVKLLVKIHRFGVAAEKIEIGILGASDLDHLFANLDSHTVARLHGVQQMPGCTADLQDTPSGFNDVSQQTLNRIVVVLVPLNEVFPSRSVLFQLFSP